MRQPVPLRALIFAGLIVAAPRLLPAQTLSTQPAVIEPGQVSTADPYSSRLFFASTGRAQRPNHGYAGAFGLGFFAFVQAAPTDRFSIGAGVPPFLTPLVLSAKYQLYRSRTSSAAVGVLHARFWGSGRGGVVYAVDTIGSEDRALTVGLGWGYQESRRGSFTPFGSSDRSAIVLIGGEYRVGPRVKLMTENYLNKDGGMLIVGFRWIGDVVGLDVGLARFLDARDFKFAPVINAAWKIGR